MIRNNLFAFAIMVSVYWTFTNFGRLYAKQRVPWYNILNMSIAYTAVITKFVGMW